MSLLNSILEVRKGRIIIDGDFIESEHPRESDGKFTEKGTGSSKSFSRMESALPKKGEEAAKKIQNAIHEDIQEKFSSIKGHSVETEFKKTKDGNYILTTFHSLEGKKGIAASTKAVITPGRSIHFDTYEMNDPEMKGKGLASSMMKAATDIGKSLGAKTGNLMAVQMGRYVWGKLGFRIEEPDREEVLAKIKKFASEKGVEVEDERDFDKLKDFFDKQVKGLPTGFAMEKEL